MPDAPTVSFDRVFARIESRRGADPAGSYVARLMERGEDAILQKIGEESCELVIAAKNGGRSERLHELADLWFHLMVWMAHTGVSLDDLRRELGTRYAAAGESAGPSRES